MLGGRGIDDHAADRILHFTVVCLGGCRAAMGAGGRRRAMRMAVVTVVMMLMFLVIVGGH